MAWGSPALTALTGLAGISWTRPLGFLALLLPLAVLLACFRRERPQPVATGTFALWAGLASGAGGERRRRRVPPARWLTIGALLLGALALAGPREERADPGRRLRVLVDRSPSMYLAHARPGADGGAATRLASGLARLDSWVAEQPAAIELEWCDSREPARVVARGAFPDAWRVPALRRRFEHSDPWGGQDRSGVLWLTDHTPPVEPQWAGLCAAGGAAVPGPVGWTDTEELVWDGQVLERRPLAVERSVAIVGDLPDWLRALVLAWAAERGVRSADEVRSATLLLEVRAVAEGPAKTVRAARDGWWFEGEARAAPLVDEVPCRTWLDGGGFPIVTFVPGRVWIGLAGETLPDGDQDAFAVSWGELLDRACVPPAEVVPLEERRPAGAAHFRPPEPEQEGAPQGEPAVPLEAILATVAFVLALAALFVRGALAP